MLHKVSSLTNTIKEEVDKHNLSLEHKEKALEVFIESYDIHKTIYGSFKHLEGIEYTAKMTARYDFMFHRAFKYIQEVKKNG